MLGVWTGEDLIKIEEVRWDLSGERGLDGLVNVCG